MLAFYLIAITQGIYLIPALIVAAVLKRAGIVQGLLLGAGVTALISFAICGGILSLS